MQPAWRDLSGGVSRERGMYGQDWYPLNVGGPNGWLGVMATLLWWGNAVKSGSIERQEDWNEAVEDAHWVLDGLLQFVR